MVDQLMTEHICWWETKNPACNILCYFGVFHIKLLKVCHLLCCYCCMCRVWNKEVYICQEFWVIRSCSSFSTLDVIDRMDFMLAAISVGEPPLENGSVKNALFAWFLLFSPNVSHGMITTNLWYTWRRFYFVLFYFMHRKLFTLKTCDVTCKVSS